MKRSLRQLPAPPVYTALLVFCLALLGACGGIQKPTPYFPEKDLGELFHTVQMRHVFQDSKTFVDCVPLMPPERILQEYEAAREKPGFDLPGFVLAHFAVPETIAGGFIPDPAEDMEAHIINHWDYLTRTPDKEAERSSLIPLPYNYVVPGGRFREVYYWDSYFTMVGLKASGRMDLVKSMLNNFAYLVGEVGFIPNGNRTYYLGRSQPPFFSSMVMLLAETEGEEKAAGYLEALQKEYAFWMDGSDQPDATHKAFRRVVEVEPGILLNRYWDDFDTPRPESYAEDYTLAQGFPEGERPALYRNLRATAESGWDFSSRWLTDGRSLDSIATTDIVPVDLNCLLFHLEGTIALLQGAKGNQEAAEEFQQRAKKRKDALMKYCWNDTAGFFFDYNFKKGRQTDAYTLAGAYPLYYQLAGGSQAAKVAGVLREKFLKTGGLVTTLKNTGQQWDYPNGWAPLHWIAIKGLMNYAEDSLAGEISSRWLSLNKKVYEDTGKMMEKYNVTDLSLEAGGGEYPNQDGFGWTNGVAITLLRLEAEVPVEDE